MLPVTEGRSACFPLADRVLVEDYSSMLARKLSSLLFWAAALFAALSPTVGSDLAAAEAPLPSATNDLTFFGWSEQHVQSGGDGTHLHPAIDAMNALPGTPYPESIGGMVIKSAFVFGCGDMTEWPSAVSRDTYSEL